MKGRHERKQMRRDRR